ncbi:MAG: radical SAM protein [Clostridiales bacterium]|jgi:MoaA/NifB/PqqE/SkfB family radical SAM enzyme|nr:radical SAM protein [Clostridiales bacterium]
MDGKVRNIVKNFLKGNLRCVEFAVTNACIAKCSFCGIWKQQPKVFVDKTKALEAIDKLADLGVGHMTLTGGEPLLHPDIVEFVRRASRHNINNSVLVAAPQLLSRKDTAARLADAGADMISVSFDSEDPEICARQRQIENIMGLMEDGIDAAKRAGLRLMASVLIWKGNCDRLETLFDKALALGFDFIAVNYPTFSESSTYSLGGEGIDIPHSKVKESLETVIRLKRAGRHPIINTVHSMRNILNYLDDPPTAKFPCLGGNRVLFVDWFFDVYPCMQLPDSLGKVFDMDERALSMPMCNKCNMSWYRDISVFFHGMRSAPLIFEAIASSGKYLT